MDPARAYLIAMVKQNRATLASLSRALGRNHAYLHQFVHRGTPKKLPDRLRRELAGLLGTSEAVLAGPAESGHEQEIDGTEMAEGIAPDSFPARLAMARAQSPYPLPSTFADAAQIDRPRYRAFEEGEIEPSLDELDRLSWLSGKSLDWLIRGES
ncbi:MAG: hypothetical protein AAF414_09905 [Pseudomonadota bacterium]